MLSLGIENGEVDSLKKWKYCMHDLIAAFDEYFEVISANTPELLKEVFHLRYQVYCEEVMIPDFEPKKFSNELEFDEYDARSAHYLLYHRPTGKIAGTVRLVLADPDDPNRPFPIEVFAAPYFDRSVIDPTKLPRRHVAEISRLVLAKEFRSRKGERRTPYGTPDNIRESQVGGDRRHFPHPVLGLFVAVYRLTAEYDITHIYAGMEPVLNRLLARFGLDLMPIGPVVEYHGARQPYLGVADKMLARIYKRRKDVWALLIDRGNARPAP